MVGAPTSRYPPCVLEDLYILRDRAKAATARGDLDTALSALLSAAAQTHVSEHDYVAILRPLEDTLARRGNPRGALTVICYLAATDPAAWKRAAALMANVPPVDRARVLAAQGQMAEAAREMEDAGLVAAAAICREKAKEWPAARALWSRLAHVTERGDDAYVAALVRFNLARCARQCGDARQAREAMVASVRLVEEAADHFESVGLRERAFDCFGVLVQIGRESGAFEDVLEVFDDPFRLTEPAKVVAGEVRYQTLGRNRESMILIVHTPREWGEVLRVRLISARPASRKETGRYERRKDHSL